MKRILAAIILLTALSSQIAHAQGNTVTQARNGAASGSCAFVQLWNRSDTPGFYYCDSSTHTWVSIATGGPVTPGGSDTQIQFNDGGIFGGDAGLAFDKTSDLLSLGSASVLAPALDFRAGSGTVTDCPAPAANHNFICTSTTTSGKPQLSLDGIGYIPFPNISSGNLGDTTDIVAVTGTGTVAGVQFSTIESGHITLGENGETSGYHTLKGGDTGSADFGVADIAGTPNRINLPTATGAAFSFLISNGANPQQTSWVVPTFPYIQGYWSGSAALNFGNLAAIGCEDLTISVASAKEGDPVILGVPNAAITANGTYSAWVSVDGTVSVRYCVLVSGDPASGTFKVSGIQQP